MTDFDFDIAEQQFDDDAHLPLASIIDLADEVTAIAHQIQAIAAHAGVEFDPATFVITAVTLTASDDCAAAELLLHRRVLDELIRAVDGAR
jgi:hypothetical protein